MKWRDQFKLDPSRGFDEWFFIIWWGVVAILSALWLVYSI